jgi:phage gpG-like protein
VRLEVAMRVSGPLFAKDPYDRPTRKGLAAAGRHLVRVVRERKLSGQVLHERSGKLKRSLRTRTTAAGDVYQVVVGSSLIYAGVHERGATIRARRGRYLHFVIDGEHKQVEQVVIPARPWLGPTGDEEAQAMADILAKTIRRELS